MGQRENNPNFLYKFVEIVGCHEYLSSDSISSAIFYGLINLLKKSLSIW